MKLQYILLLLISIFSLSCTSEKEINSNVQPPSDGAKSQPAQVPQEIKDGIIKHKLYRYPELTVLLAVKDANKTSKLIEKAGGTVTYNPNLGQGHRIPFIIATLSPEKIMDEEFIKTLALRAVTVDHPMLSNIKPVSQDQNLPELPALQETIYVPIEDVNISALRKRTAGEALGENTIVAVIDTGIDASHPVFQDRVIYWAENTQQTYSPIIEAEPKEGKISVFKNVEIVIPDRINLEEKVYVSVFDEKAMGTQISDTLRIDKEKMGLDLNQNGIHDDRFFSITGIDKETKNLITFVDINGNEKLEEGEISKPLMDFNLFREKKNPVEFESFVQFNDRNRKIAFPLLHIKDGKGVLQYLALGLSNHSHGTHVAGIIGGNGKQIKGVAPKTKFMSMKVCSAWSCTEAAILRGLVEAFYNPMGYVPDVVNISLGSHERYVQDFFDYIVRDLAAKFGATFFISASNSGPGFRSINALGTLGPAIMVAAHVSKKTMIQHYNLNPQINVPDNNLLFFTSLGPSYTGLLRPNISAPGSALSSTALIDNRSSMYNGTSMSSPLAAGAGAALLSLAKKNPAYALIEAKKQKKINSIRDTSNASENYSMLSLPLALRTAFEDTATRMKDYTIVHQGFGLIDVNAAYDRFIEIVSGLTANTTQIMELAINHNQKQNRLYDRSVQIDRAKKIELSIEDDGEASDDEILNFQNTPLNVVLEKVEVQSTDGSMATLMKEKKLPFSIATPGVEGKNGRTATVILSNRVKNSFTSVRHLKRMTRGKTYVAHYNVFQRGLRILTLTDVVHMPILLTDTQTSLDVPGIQPDAIVGVAQFGKKNQKIKANAFHRYPVATSSRDMNLHVQLGFSANATGTLYLQVFDPDGRGVGFQAISRSPQKLSDLQKAELIVPIHKPLNTDVETYTSGTFEITVSAASGRWMSPTTYDLVVTAKRLKPSLDHIKVKKGEKKILSVMNSSRQVRNITVSLTSPMELVKVGPMEVMPNRWTLQKLDFPQSAKADKTTTVIIKYPEDFNRHSGYWGRIDHRLFKKSEKDDSEFPNFTEAFRAEDSVSNPQKRVFKNVKPSELYVALETIWVIPDSFNPDKAVKKVTLDAFFPDIKVDPTILPKVSLLGQGQSNSDVFLIEVVSPDSLKTVKMLRATLMIQSGQKGMNFQIPVTVLK